MKLWVIQKREPGMDDPWGYDCTYGVVVRAADEKAARALAASRAGDEGEGVWSDAALTSCEPLSEQGPEEVILHDFLAG